MKNSVALALVLAGAILQTPLAAQQPQPFVRDPKIPVDADDEDQGVRRRGL
jgi:hypothetical protein